MNSQYHQSNIITMPACPYHSDRCSQDKLRCYSKEFTQCLDFKDITDANRKKKSKGIEDLKVWEGIDWNKVSEDNR